MPEGMHITMSYWLIRAIPVWVLFRVVILIVKKIRKRNIDIKNEFIINLFALYLIFVAGIVFLPLSIYWAKQKYYSLPNINYVPFKDLIKTIIYASYYKYIFINVFGNIAMFIPFGLLFPLLWGEKFKGLKVTILSGILLSFSIEVLQFIEGNVFHSLLSRSSDINDIILNTLGALIGYFAYVKLLKKNRINSSLNDEF
ncbi:MAG: VanZ family protein [Bacillota bacterium]|nr:VanZ family protein [Bacillota bacterium]